MTHEKVGWSSERPCVVEVHARPCWETRYEVIRAWVGSIDWFVVLDGYTWCVSIARTGMDVHEEDGGGWFFFSWEEDTGYH